MGGRQCSCCSASASSEISKAVASGESFRSIASRYGVTYAAVHRHAQNCLKTHRNEKKAATVAARTGAADSSRFETLEPSTLVAATARLIDEALDLLEHAKKADDRRTALVALREARDGLALLMKIAGLLQLDGGVVIDARRQTLIANVAVLSVEELRALARGTIDQEPEPC
jgi:hypothetical protein